MPLAPNLGECPPHARGKRVKVVLRNGLTPPESWPASGKDGCRWELTPEGRPSRAFDIVEWEIAG